MDQLMQKLMISKKIMDKHDTIGRGNSGAVNSTINVDSFDTPQAKYNIPQEFLQQEQTAPVISQSRMVSGPPSVDAIKNSKLPEEIKRLMIEHPIEKPQQPTAGLSNELIEKASRLMKEQSNNYVPESAQKNIKKESSPKTDSSNLRNMIKEAVEETLREHGIIHESVEKTNEIFSFKVGKHIFEGKITKVKKIS